MPASGHLRKSKDALHSSAFPSTADIAAWDRLVRKVPKPEINPKAKALDARRAFFRAAQRISLVAWQRLSDERTWRTTASPADRPMSLGGRRARSHVPTTREPRRWSILNPSIIVLNKCKAL